MAAGLGFKDFVTGEVLTAADVDGYLMQGVWVFASAAARDAAVTSPQEGNFAFLKDTNTTTYYTGSAWTNLVSTSNPAFLAEISTNQSINSGTFTKVQFDTEIIDSDSGYDPTTNYRYTVQTGQGGNYLIGFDTAWGVYSVGHQVQMLIYKNGAAYESPSFPFRDSGSDVVSTIFSKVVALAAGDYVEAYVQQNSGVARTLYSPNASFWGHKI